LSRLTQQPSSPSPGSVAVPGDKPATLLDWLQSERDRLAAELPALERVALAATEQLAESDVVRRHVILHADRFTPREREAVIERGQLAAEERQRAAVTAQTIQEQLRLLEAIISSLRQGLALVESGNSQPAKEQATDEIHPQVVAEALAPPPRAGALEIFQAVESERLRIARDLHDGPAQVLADLVLKAEILDRVAARTPEELPVELEHFKSNVRNAVADIRRFMFDLRPDSLDDLGLAATMRRYSSEYQDRTGITCRFNVVGEERRLGVELEEGIFRIIQEALTNAQRHARPKVVEVAVTTGAAEALLKIRDDGAGFDPNAPEPADGRRRLGLVGMRERAEALGGTLEVKSKPGKGTEIIGRFPVRPAK
jgi:two-component system sensor histidine kinase DegS